MEVAGIFYYIVSIFAGALYIFLMHRGIYSDGMSVPVINADGQPETLHVERLLSPAQRLMSTGFTWLYGVEMLLIVVMMICALLKLLGVKSKTVTGIQIAGCVLSLGGFIAIMILTH